MSSPSSTSLAATQPLDDASAHGSPKATVIVTQRERFGMTRESIDSLYAHTAGDFEVIVVDGNSPAATAEYLRAASEDRGFRLIRKERFLTPNQARNIGAAAAQTPYVAFVDNDVLYTDGWLDALVVCAEETGAEVVAPLTCQGLPAHSEIHHAGGIYAENGDMDAFVGPPPEGGRRFVEKMIAHGEKVVDWAGKLEAGETGMCEFHCVLVRRDVFERTGPLDERLLSTKEHIDFSMAVRQAGGKVWFEPKSVVTYVFPCRARPLTAEDWPFFALRWSDEYGRRSLEHFVRKWQLKTKPTYVRDKRGIYAMRRMQGILIPMMRRVPVLGEGAARRMARLVAPLERMVNRGYVAYHDRRASS